MADLDRIASGLDAPHELVAQAGLARPRRRRHQHRARGPVLDAGGERPLERVELGLAAHAGRGLAEQRARRVERELFAEEHVAPGGRLGRVEAHVEQAPRHLVDQDRLRGAVTRSRRSTAARSSTSPIGRPSLEAPAPVQSAISASGQRAWMSSAQRAARAA